jgi:glycosyltransferase involved in cell wall biosynthesis
LSIITMTKGDRPVLLERCKASVQAALPYGAVHRVILSPTLDAAAKFKYAKESEFVAFVDDDDTISPDSISRCMSAIIEHDAGLAYTREVTVDLNLNKLNMTQVQTLSYANISDHPRAAHHLALIRSECLDERAVQMHEKFNMGIDWYMNASAALNERGAVHVPIDGYFWTIHDGQHSKYLRAQYNLHMREMSKLINDTFKFNNRLIPTHGR